MYDTAVTDNTPFSAEVFIMRAMHWSWADLMATPADVVEAVLERLTAEDYWRIKAAKRKAAS